VALTLSEVESIVRSNPGGVVLIDEAYIDFAQAGSAVPLTQKYENLLVAQTFSKSYSLAGLRAGFAVGNPSLIDGLQRVKDAFNSYPLDLLAQTGAEAAILDVDYWNETRSRIITTRDKTMTELRGLGYDVLDSQANFLFAKSIDAKRLYDHLLGRKVLVRYWNKPRINEFLRITVGTGEEMEVFIKCVKQF
jgi:histidinol-phosphate aminotransferase